MTTLELLKQCLRALNAIPNTYITGEREWTNTYELASIVGKHIKEIEEKDAQKSALHLAENSQYGKFGTPPSPEPITNK